MEQNEPYITDIYSLSLSLSISHSTEHFMRKCIELDRVRLDNHSQTSVCQRKERERERERERENHQISQTEDISSFLITVHSGPSAAKVGNSTKNLSHKHDPFPLVVVMDCVVVVVVVVVVG